MARISKCDKLSEHDRLKLVGRIGQGATWETLAAEFGVAKSSIAEWATRNGYGRSPVEAKRKAVDTMLCKPETGSQTGSKPETGNADIDAAAERDVKVARAASGVCISIIARLAKAVQDETEPKTLKVIAEASGRAWDTYARINKLDDPKPELNNDFATAAEAVRRKLGL